MYDDYQPDGDIFRQMMEIEAYDPRIVSYLEGKYEAVFAALAHPELGPLDPQDEDVISLARELDAALQCIDAIKKGD